MLYLVVVLVKDRNEQANGKMQPFENYETGNFLCEC